MRQGISDYKVTEIFCLADDFWSDFLVYGKSWHRLSVQDTDHFSDSSHLTHIDIGLTAPYYGLIKQRIAWNKKHVDLSDTFCICALYPFRNTQHKRRQTCAHSEVVKFDHFEIRVMYQLSSAGKFNSVAVPQPVSQHHGGRLNSARNRRLDLCRQLQRHSSGVFHKSPHPYMHKSLDWSADPATLVSRHTYTHGNIRLGPLTSSLRTQDSSEKRGAICWCRLISIVLLIVCLFWCRVICIVTIVCAKANTLSTLILVFDSFRSLSNYYT